MFGDVKLRADDGRRRITLNSILRGRKDVGPSRRSQKRRSLTVSTCWGWRGSSRRGSRSSEYQAAAAAAAQNHNRQDNYCHSDTTSPYISVAVRFLENGSGRCTWCRESWHWLSSVVERQCPPGRTSWVLVAVVATVGSLLRITLHITVHPISLTAQATFYLIIVVAFSSISFFFFFCFPQYEEGLQAA